MSLISTVVLKTLTLKYSELILFVLLHMEFDTVLMMISSRVLEVLAFHSAAILAPFEVSRTRHKTNRGFASKRAVFVICW